MVPIYVSLVNGKSFKLASVLLMEVKSGSILRTCLKDLGFMGA
jgi:hypothetical protein